MHNPIILHKAEPTTTFEVPEGNFSGELTNVGLYDSYNEGDDKALRFTFKVNLGDNNGKTYLVARNFVPNSAKLKHFLERWLGRDFFGKQDVGLEHLKKLTGTKVELTVNHINNAGFKKPFRNL